VAWLKKNRTWYADGLAFECTECGRCCSGPEEGHVWISPEEIRVAAEHLKTTAEEFTRKYTRRVGRRVSLIEVDNADCVFLQENNNGFRHCAIYPVRPVQCCTWPFWPSNITSPLAWARAAMRCPGVNRGKKHDLAQIEDGKSRSQ